MLLSFTGLYVPVHLYLQELLGKFLIKGKRLNKLESIFAPDVTAAEDTDVTEEEESNDEDEDEQKTKVGGRGSRQGRHPYRQQTFLLDTHLLSF